ncbi:putative Multidrug Resistance Associated Protein (MRP) [Monocercomonoides exilis]|uniref:putative Multidrug Resistance Associated Protein (MRP) n=1 Tax=Monocercomonoides exilis TaxID=2049356 RepID=UPI0035595D27|nr:putative Multidrug Resistance Associated Protein (MRP) [Monocercomonoides exilis]|eukprot:MONOS_12235.1-p1 / transcript=MONOS_12235.1 / gene=MONOS_12235 / organism=Monocercomonoides_exilis_PA203 / gene_product=Multidrug Resistance Associated Protein (MRP) / transcript_product=Multidrug Resistance Associated Protein (MRP) / location=Mono_scaffold00663:23085-28319(-) / protein_length=1683 / sequence_SO=supercontig / SO=protein_coding / is_pseudo=false
MSETNEPIQKTPEGETADNEITPYPEKENEINPEPSPQETTAELEQKDQMESIIKQEPTKPEPKLEEIHEEKQETKQETKSESKPVEPKKEFIRKKNREEEHFCFFNIFFCFFFPFVCRVSPVTEEDIYVVDSRDTTEKATAHFRRIWEPQYEKYLKEKKEYEQLKAEDPNLKKKPPSQPSIIFPLVKALITPSIVLATFLLLFSIGFAMVQPRMMKTVLEAVMKKALYDMSHGFLGDNTFPYASAIILILCPWLNSLFDTWGNRLFFHFASQMRAAFVGLIYDKTLLLNITSQSNIDTGRLLTLISADSRTVAEMMPMFLMMIWLPVQFFVPFGFLLYEFGVCTFMAFAVVILLLPLETWLVSKMMMKMKEYLSLNDQRNKITNETLQAMRVVKYTGLEEVFTKKINEPRLKQTDTVLVMMTIMQIVNALMRITSQLVNLTTFALYIYTQHITQDMFAVSVMTNLGYLIMMTQPTTMMPMIFQGVGLMNVSVKRIKDFMLLPELIIEKREKPNDPTIALQIRNGAFKWGDPPEIPLSMAEQAELKKKMAAKKKEEAKKERDKSQNKEETPSLFGKGPVVVELQVPAEDTKAASAQSETSFSSSPSSSTQETESASASASASSSSSSASEPSNAGTAVVRPSAVFVEEPISVSTTPDAASDATSSESAAEATQQTEAKGASDKQTEAVTEPASAATSSEESKTDAESSSSSSSSSAESNVLEPESEYSPAGQDASAQKTGSPAGTSTPPMQGAANWPNTPLSVFQSTPSVFNPTPNHNLFAPSTSPSPSPTPLSSTSPSPSPTPSPSSSAHQRGPVLQDVNITLPKGSLTMVVGGVGSGKSSLGAAIIGDAEKLEGTIEVDGNISYCAQTAWINNNTVRGNITFGSEYNEEKYREVVRICALEPDFKTLSAGDQTEIGEKGVNLSGGQKARIQLARALYSDRDIYILDDPLSAVDAHVGRFLFDECIMDSLKNKGKTVMLMTNQLQFLDRADNILLLAGGRIAAQGTEEQLKAQGIDFSEYIIKGGEGEEDEKGHHHHHRHGKRDKHAAKKKQTHATDEDLKGADSAAGKQLMTEEEQETGTVPMKVYMSYVLSLLPAWGVPLFFLLMLITDAVMVMAQYWMGVIGTASQYPSISYDWKIGIYGFFALGTFVFLMFRACIVGPMVKRSNNLNHQNLLDRVLHCPSSFFDTTPLGRILNRFTGDIPQIDQQLPSMLLQVISMWLALIGQVVIVAVDTPFFLAIGLPGLVVYYLVLTVYSRASRNLQRLESMSRSPVLSHFSETVTGAGLSTIRTYKLEDAWRDKFYKLNDEWNVRFIVFREGQKWATLYSSVISTILMAGVVILGWFFMEPAKLGVAISSAMTFGMLGIQIVQQNVELDSRMTSYQRIKFYSTQLPQELDHTKKDGAIDPPENWPSEGKVEYDNVTFRYRPGLPFVLKNVQFSFRGGEKIGVCGRTGAGKSSLLHALFRLIELDPKLQPKMIDVSTGFPIDPDPNEIPNSGRVLIDDIDISKVNLSRVRRSIAIIPQDPTLFSGTLRYNLDIGGRRSDDEIWEVLELIEMKDVVMGLEFGLDTVMAEGGSNFSAGQRQLICFGRAMLNNCRIVIMDEATANVDVETDAKIQNTIRRVFVKQTVIVIAHRLNTIMNSDRIMVMDQGHVAELDSPANLLANPDSAFNGLIHSLNS